MAVGLITSTAPALLASEAARFTILLAVFGPADSHNTKRRRGCFYQGSNTWFCWSASRDSFFCTEGCIAIREWSDGTSYSGPRKGRTDHLMDGWQGTTLCIIGGKSKTAKRNPKPSDWYAICNFASPFWERKIRDPIWGFSASNLRWAANYYHTTWSNFLSGILSHQPVKAVLWSGHCWKKVRSNSIIQHILLKSHD